MPNCYARQTALHDAGGRVDYITNPKRQERLLGSYDAASAKLDGYWEHQARECQAAHKHAREGTKVVEGRELVIQLSNSLLDRMTPEEICRTMAEDFQRRYDRPCTVALHFNKRQCNLHAHLIYSERELLQEPVYKEAKRDLFMDAAGRRHYKKAEILDASGQLRPGCFIIPAGATYETRFFGPRDACFSQPAWLRECKADWVVPLRNGALRGDVEIGLFDYSTGKLPLQHVGTLRNVDRATARQIRAGVEQYNDMVRQYNALVDKGVISPAVAKKLQETVLQAPQRNGILHQILDQVRSNQVKDAVLRETKRREQLLVERGLIGAHSLQQLSTLIDQGKIPVLWLDDAGEVCCTPCTTPERAAARSAETAAPFQVLAEPARAGRGERIQEAERLPADADPNRAESMDAYRDAIRVTRSTNRTGEDPAQDRPAKTKSTGRDRG